MSDDTDEAIGAIIVMVFTVIAIAIAVITVLTIGSAIGAAIGVRNYYFAFRNNIKMESSGI